MSFLKEYERQYAATPQPVQVAFASVKADAKDAKPATVPENPDDIDRTDDTPSEKIIAADSANRAAWLSFSQ